MAPSRTTERRREHGPLEIYPQGDTDIIHTRLIDAPRNVVFAALTNEALFEQWFVPEGCVLESVGLEAKPGGYWSYVMRNPDGSISAMKGEILELDSPSLLVLHFPGDKQGGDAIAHSMHVKYVFSDEAGKTRFHETLSCATKEVRDATLDADFDPWLRHIYERLAALLPEFERHLNEDASTRS